MEVNLKKMSELQLIMRLYSLEMKLMYNIDNKIFVRVRVKKCPGITGWRWAFSQHTPEMILFQRKKKEIR